MPLSAQFVPSACHCDNHRPYSWVCSVTEPTNPLYSHKQNLNSGLSEVFFNERIGKRSAKSKLQYNCLVFHHGRSTVDHDVKDFVTSACCLILVYYGLSTNSVLASLTNCSNILSINCGSKGGLHYETMSMFDPIIRASSMYAVSGIPSISLNPSMKSAPRQEPPETPQASDVTTPM
jgi:hypothetical protein